MLNQFKVILNKLMFSLLINESYFVLYLMIKWHQFLYSLMKAFCGQKSDYQMFKV
jgi:hypothetical protein